MSGRRRMMTGGSGVAVDLSYMDIHGNVQSTQNTANCYVVKEAGTYKFPMVFGNAIKDGAVNSKAYGIPNAFFSHSGAAINTPYVEVQSGEASSVELTVADTSGVFSELGIINGVDCRYIQFRINSVPDTGANGVVSVKDSAGTVMWSWHIWVWPDDLTPVYVHHTSSMILPVNLATKKDSANSGRFVNWYYQFGRHVPFLPSASYLSYYQANNYGTGAAVTSLITADSYADGIKRPGTFYCNADGGSWCLNGLSPCAWDVSGTYDGYPKTVYDPCPVGFMVPGMSALMGFQSVLYTTTHDYGTTFMSSDINVYFPWLGSYNSFYGKFGYIGGYGHYWTNTSEGTVAIAASLSYDSIVNDSFYCAAGCSIRPVTEPL